MLRVDVWERCDIRVWVVQNWLVNLLFGGYDVLCALQRHVVCFFSFVVYSACVWYIFNNFS